MTPAARRLDTAARDSIRRVLRLLELNDWVTARWEIDALLALGTLSAACRLLLEGLRSYADQDKAAGSAQLTACLALDPRMSYAHYWLAANHVADGRFAEAMADVEAALQSDPDMPEGWFLYGGLARRQNNVNVAIHSLIRAIQCDSENGRYWHTLNLTMRRTKAHGPMLSERSLLLEALQREAIDFSIMDQIIYAALDVVPGVQQLIALAGAGTLNSCVQSGEAISLLGDELLLRVLTRTTLQHSGYEDLLTELRRALLTAIAAGRIPAAVRDVAVRFASALAIYAQTTEFVLFATEAEGSALAGCRDRLGDERSDDPGLPLLAAIVACYEPLVDVPRVPVTRLLASPANGLPEFREMLDLHLVEPLAIRSHRARVESFSAISNDVSLAVQRQYEENPYPRWRFLGEPQAATFDNRISRCLPHLREDQRPRLQALPTEPLEILVAGCGTGRHALCCAREYPSTRVLAVDLSRSSLAYASMKAVALGITNITFRQGDLLALPVLARQFDVIESSGVLHHMAEPAAGLAALTRCLRPGGWMKLSLYSYVAREAVRVARARIAERGFAPTPEGIRDFRHAIMRDESDPLHASCAKFRDFYSLSECRDLLFHVQEHQFTTQGLAELVAAAGLEFMGFEADLGFAANAQPAITDWRSLDQWGDFEKAHPDFFGSMYVMWLRKPGGRA